MEIWKPLPFEPIYSVSNLGNVKRTHGGRWNTEGKNRKPWYVRGYSYVSLRVKGKLRGYQIHRLVMLAFHGESKLHVNHINGDRSDNRLCNLEYVTPKQNQAHSRDVLGTFNMGSTHHQAKLNEDNVREIFELKKNGERVSSIATKFNVSTTLIYFVLNRKWWKHVKI